MSKTRSRRPRNDLFECVVGAVEAPKPKPAETWPWFRYFYLGAWWSVELADLATVRRLADDENAEGVTMRNEHRIVVWDCPDVQYRNEIWYHEHFHGGDNGHAGSVALQRALGCTAEQLEDLEEAFVGFIAPLSFGVLMAAGMLTFPEPPKRKPGRGRR